MRRDDVTSILCKLQCCGGDFQTMKSSFYHHFSGRLYEINFQREGGKVMNFQIQDLGKEEDEKN